MHTFQLTSALQKISEMDGWTLGQIELESNLKDYDAVFDKVRTIISFNILFFIVALSFMFIFLTKFCKAQSIIA